jgi:uncharacterized membrane protein YedE/YeeE
MNMEWLSRAWPWYVAGPIIGLFVPALLLLGNKQFGISSNLRHVCAALLPRDVAFFKYDWRKSGGWNLAFLAGIVAGGFIGGWLLAHPAVTISPETQADLAALGIQNFSGLVPTDVFSWASLLSLKGFVAVVIGGFLVGFGTAYSGGCTSGHAISGLADLQLPSLVAVIGFFTGGLIATRLILPLIL